MVSCAFQHLVLSDFYIFFLPNWGKMASHCNLDLHFPEQDDAEHLHMFFGYAYFLLHEMSLYSHFTDEKT